MTRGAFLKLKIPNLPYCAFHLENLHKGSSNRFWESIHVFNVKKNWQINVFWRNSGYSTHIDKSDNGEVSVSYHNMNEPERDRIHTVIDCEKDFSQEKLNGVFKQIMFKQLNIK